MPQSAYHFIPVIEKYVKLFPEIYGTGNIALSLAAKKLSDFCNGEMKDLHEEEEECYNVIRNSVNSMKLIIFDLEHKVQFTYVEKNLFFGFIDPEVYEAHGSYYDYFINDCLKPMSFEINIPQINYEIGQEIILYKLSLI